MRGRWVTMFPGHQKPVLKKVLISQGVLKFGFFLDHWILASQALDTITVCVIQYYWITVDHLDHACSAG